MLKSPKFLFLDIELAPNLATVWDIWNQNIGLSQLLETSYVLCWSAKWLGSKEILFDSVNKSSKQGVIKSIWKLIDEADIICHYNGKRFDIPTLNKEFLLHRMTPPRPYKQLDLYKTVKTQFRFISNKLAHITKQLGFEGKVKVEHKLWLDCMNGDPLAWKKMEIYNKRDITELEKLYKVLLPWITNHPNLSMYRETTGEVCTNCGKSHLNSRGYYHTNTSTYKRYRCMDCGTWMRSKVSEKKIKNKNILTQIVY